MADVNRPRVCHTKWSNSEKENRYCPLVYEYGTRKMVEMNLCAGQEQKHRCSEHVAQGRRGEGRADGGSSIDIHTPSHVWSRCPAQCPVMPRRRRWEWGVGGSARGRSTPIHTADSLHCAAEANTTLKSNYTPLKKLVGCHGKEKPSWILLGWDQ